MTNALPTQDTDRDLVLTRVLNAPRDKVFRAWTDPKQAVQWWGPKSFPATFLEMDVREGGQWVGRLRSVADGSILSHRGVFREIVEPSLVSFTFQWDEEGERGMETLVTLTFEDLGGSTRFTLLQTSFITVEERDGHVEGWNSALDRLEKSVGAKR